MDGQKHRRRATTLLTGIVALAAFAGPAQAADSRPAGMTKAEYRALVLRSDALNEQYRVASAPDKTAALDQQEYRALVLRSKALNAKYGLGDARVVAGTPRTVTVAENGFAWGDFAIGAAAMLGLALLVGGTAAGLLVMRRGAFPPRSLS